MNKGDKKAVLAALLADDERNPLALNPSERGHKLTPAERRRLIAAGLRKRRNDALYAALVDPKSPVGESR